MKYIFDNVSDKCSKLTTIAYSTSFSFGIKALDKRLHAPIYGIYGFVRFADEIVDTFHDYDKHRNLLGATDRYSEPAGRNDVSKPAHTSAARPNGGRREDFSGDAL